MYSLSDLYPTGGYSEFNFEMNRTIYPEDPYGYAAFVGGLRVQSINHYDEDGNFVSGKEYEYEESDVGLSLPAIANMGKQFVSTYVYSTRRYSNKWNEASFI